jgi:hypothetical protein
MAVNDLITFRKGTASAWTSANPVLASGEPGYDLTNSILKIGDGVSNWVALSGIGSTSLNNSSSSSSVGVRGIISTTGTLTSFAVSGGYPVGYLDLFQDGIKLVSDLDFSATDGSNVTLSNSVPSGTVLEYLTMASGVSSGGGSLSGSVTIPGSDPYWDSVLLLLRGDGNFTDSSKYGRTLTAYGNAAATAAGKYGTNSIALDGTGDYLAVSSSDFAWGTSDWTVEAWVWLNATGANGGIFSTFFSNGSPYGVSVFLDTAGRPVVMHPGGANVSASTAITTGQWVHIAAVRSSGTATLFVNGSSVGSVSASDSHGQSNVVVGRVYTELDNNYWNGRIAELRVTKAARYTANFTPPTAALPTTIFQASPQILPVTITGSGGGSSSYDSRWDLFLPPAPTGLTAAVGNAQATLSWTAPTVLAQTPITDYVVQHSSNSGSTWTTFSDGTSTSTSATVTGLTNGTAYVFRVAATNDIGTGSYSAASSAVTPNSASVPDAPTSLRNADNYWGCSSNDTMWNAPVSNGGSAITGYVWRIGSGATTSVAPSSGTRPAGSYTGGFIDNHAPIGSFQVAAVNAVGTGLFASITLQQDCN